MVLGYTQNSNQKLSLYVDRANVVGVIQKAKNLAMEKYKSTSADGSTICAFGVHFENNSPRYFIYSQQKSNGVCSVINDFPCYEYTSGYNQCSFISKIEQSFSLNQANIFTTSSDVYFVPPYFTTNANSIIIISNKKNSQFNVKIIVNGLNFSAN